MTYNYSSYLFNNYRLGRLSCLIGKKIAKLSQLTCLHYSDRAFNPKRVLILTKLSRYDFEKHKNSELSEMKLEENIKSRGSDYKSLLYHHNIHKEVENTVKNAFIEAGIETKVVTRFNYTTANINWADAVVTTGGDGTYLLAATQILNCKKPVIGFNSDPLRSKGHLCLPKIYSTEAKMALNKLFQGKFRWTFRKRIRVTLMGDGIYDPPIELHEQELTHPENRYLDIDPQLPSMHTENLEVTDKKRRVLPILALNEVFVGECISARVSYMELSFDLGIPFKLKCSGLIASTGTGSTSWTYNINKLTQQNMSDIVFILRNQTGFNLKYSNPKFIRKATENFNEMLIIPPEDDRMVYTIRDLLLSSPLEEETDLQPRGFSKKIHLKSRMFDACLVIDGGASFRFNDGTRAILEVNKEDALRTVTLDE